MHSLIINHPIASYQHSLFQMYHAYGALELCVFNFIPWVKTRGHKYVTPPGFTQYLAKLPTLNIEH